MDGFVDLGVSFFDDDFTLDPYAYIEKLYPREDVLGFSADGMNFIFRFEEARQVLLNRDCRKDPVANQEIEKREAMYAVRYPRRAKNAELCYAMGEPNLRMKKLLLDFLDRSADRADFSGARPVFQKLSVGGRIDDYIESIRTLPLRALLDTCGLGFTEEQLVDLNQAGFDFLKPFDNFFDDSRLDEAEDALGRIWHYLDEAMDDLPVDAPIRELVERSREAGFDDQTLRVNIAAFFIISMANTAGVSSGYVLRNLIRYPEVRAQLAENPSLAWDDNVITELLRRDNHVKALSRQVHADFEIGQFRVKKGDSLYLFFPGVNLDPAHWSSPLSIDLSRKFAGISNIVFGGSIHMCIGKRLGLAFLKHMVDGFVNHLPAKVGLSEAEIEADGEWVTERIITKMPIIEME